MLMRLDHLFISVPTPVSLPASLSPINQNQHYSAPPPPMNFQFSHLGSSAPHHTNDAVTIIPQSSSITSCPEEFPPSPLASKPTRAPPTPPRQPNTQHQISAALLTGCGMKIDCRALTLVLYGLTTQSGGRSTVLPPISHQQISGNMLSVSKNTCNENNNNPKK